MKIFVVGFLVLILASLGSALFYLIRDKGKTDRTLKALMLRIGLSITLFIMLMVSYKLGIFPARH
jgi:hypothetical protein